MAGSAGYMDEAIIQTRKTRYKAMEKEASLTESTSLLEP
jgi:hypothetical protein